LFFPIVYTVFGEETGQVPQSMPVIAVDASESRGGFFTLDVSCRDQSDTPVTMFTIPSGKRFHNYGKSPFSMGKSTISMAIFKYFQ
jgi:hypothetical protein